METDLIPNVRGNVQNLRTIWSTKVQEEQKLSKPRASVYRSHSQVPQVPKQQIKIEIKASISNDDAIIHREPIVKFDDESKIQRQI